MNINISGKRRKGLMTFTSSLCLAFSVSAAMAAPPTTIAGTYGTLTIGDLPGTIDRIGSLANKVNPGLSAESIRSLLGMQLGDAGLTSIPAGSGLMAVKTKTGGPFFLLETAEGKAETLAETIKQKGPQVAVINSKLLAIAMDEASLTQAKGEAGTAAAAELAKSDDKFMLFTVDADTLIADKGDDLKAFLKTLPSKMAAGGDSKTSVSADMFTIIGNAAVAMGKRSDVATIKVDLSSDGILFEKTMYPVGGVTAAKPEGPSGQELLKSVNAGSNELVKYEAYMDTQSMVKVIGDIMSEAFEGTGVAQADQDSIKGLMGTAAEGFGDGLAGWMGLDGSGTNAVYVISVLNKDKAIQYVEDGIAQANSGALGRMYTSMGMKTSARLTKNAGTVDGEPFHAFSVKMDAPEGSKTASMTMFNEMNNGKFTFVNDKMVLTLGNASLEDAVAAAKSGNAPSAMEIKARAELPANGAFYADYDAGALGTALKKENAQIGSAIESLKGTPILEAFYVDEESLKFVMLVPGDMITKAISSFQSMAQQSASDDDSSTDSDDNSKPSDDGAAPGESDDSAKPADSNE